MPVTEKQKANLKPGGVKPGAGRPKGSVSMVHAAREYLIAHPDKVDDIIAKIVNNAAEGKLDCIKELKIWIDGLPTQPIKTDTKLDIDIKFV